MKYTISAMCAFVIAIGVANIIGCAAWQKAKPVVSTIAVSECERLVREQHRPELVMLCSQIPQLIEQLVGEVKAGQCK